MGDRLSSLPCELLQDIADILQREAPPGNTTVRKLWPLLLINKSLYNAFVPSIWRRVDTSELSVRTTTRFVASLAAMRQRHSRPSIKVAAVSC